LYFCGEKNQNSRKENCTGWKQQKIRYYPGEIKENSELLSPYIEENAVMGNHGIELGT